MALNDKRQLVHKDSGAVLHSDLTSLWVGSTDEGAGDPYISLIKPLPTTAGPLYIASTSTDDVNETGSGAHTIRLSGLDSQLLPFSELIELNGTTKVETNFDEWLRVCEDRVITADSETGQTGDIFVGDDTYDPADPDGAGNIYAVIPVTGISANDSFAKNNAQQACFTVPAGYRAKILKIYATREAGNTDGRMWLRHKNVFDGVWNYEKYFQLADASIELSYTEDDAEVFPELTDLELVGVTDGTDVEVNGGFVLLLERVRDVAAKMNGSLTITDVNDYGFTVSWNAVKNTNFSQGYRVDVIDQSTSKVVKSLSTTSTTITVVGLLDGRDYTVNVYNKFETAFSDPITETDIAVGLAIPSSFTATGGNGVVNLSWNAVSNADSYEIRKTGFNNITDSASPYEDTNVVNDTEYEYFIRSVKNNGDVSDWSTAETATPSESSTDLYIVSLVDPAYGSQPEIATSDAIDGTWTVSTLGSSGYTFLTERKCIETDGSEAFIRTDNGSGGYEAYTYDGSTFTLKASAAGSRHDYYNSKWWANVSSSLDSTTDFATYSDEAADNIIALAYNGSVYAAILSDESVVYSSNGTSWSASTTTIANAKDITALNGTFVVVTSAPTIYTSTDGDTWTSQTASDLTISSGVVYWCFINGTRVEVTAFAADYSTCEIVYASQTDFTTWTDLPYTATGQGCVYPLGEGLFGAFDFAGTFSNCAIYTESGGTFTKRKDLDNDQLPYPAVKITT